MGTTQTPRLSELARPGKRAVVATTLTELQGPTSGIVELPHRMFWQADRRFDLDDSVMLQLMYETVLLEAVTQEELRSWLHGPTLNRIWPRLYLPHGVRRDWEVRHPDLRAARLASSEQSQPHHDEWLARREAA